MDYEDEEEQAFYSDERFLGDEVKKKVISLGIHAYSGGSETPGSGHFFLFIRAFFVAYLLIQRVLRCFSFFLSFFIH
jgi:hypothetical protein